MLYGRLIWQRIRSSLGELLEPPESSSATAELETVNAKA